MTRKGAFTSVAAAYQLSIFGLDDRHICGFGFPNERHVLLGQRAGFYTEVDSLVELRWDCRRRSASLTITARSVRIAEKAAVISRLWQAMAEDLVESIVVVRDVPYLQYRYESHPRFDYRVFLVKRRWGTPLGLLVLRFEGDVCRLIDLVGALVHVHSMVDMARQIAASAGCTRLLAWITAGQAGRFESSGSEVVPLDIKVPGNCFVERVPVDTLKGRWWLMMGDTDFL